MKEGVLTVSPTDRSPAPLHPQMRIVLVEVRANLTGFRSARRLEEHSSGCVWVVWRCGLEGYLVPHFPFWHCPPALLPPP